MIDGRLSPSGGSYSARLGYRTGARSCSADYILCYAGACCGCAGIYIMRQPLTFPYAKGELRKLLPRATFFRDEIRLPTHSRSRAPQAIHSLLRLAPQHGERHV
jgi:hypothetical protein